MLELKTETLALCLACGWPLLVVASRVFLKTLAALESLTGCPHLLDQTVTHVSSVLISKWSHIQ